MPRKRPVWKAARLALAAGSAMIAVAAYGQDTPAPAAADAPAAAPAATADSGDIIVTAQRRSERLRDVPISVTALNEQKLSQAGITNITDLNRVTPGLDIPIYFGFVQFAIRGISSTTAGLGDSSNVALYLDGVYQTTMPGQLLDMPDVEQVEVLKGPQGTLYGQNAVGGAINVRTLTPSFTTKGKVAVSYGSYNDRAIRGYITGPLSDTIAVSFSASYRRRHGYLKDIVHGGHDYGLNAKLVRGKIMFKPNENVSLTLGGYYSDQKDSSGFATSPIGGNSAGYRWADFYGLNIPRPRNARQFAMSIDPWGRFKNWGVSLLGQFNTGIGSISTTTAYYGMKEHSWQDPDMSVVNLGYSDFHLKSKVFIQEVNFVSKPIGPVTLAGGLFFMHKMEGYLPYQLFNITWPGVFGVDPNDPPPAPTTTGRGDYFYGVGGPSKMKKNSYAGYLEANVKATDNLTLTLAGRYSYERHNYWDSVDVGFGSALPPLLHHPKAPVSFKNFSPRAVVRYRFDNGNNVYASFTKGFKSGFLPQTSFTQPKVNPEKITAYEVGFKGRVLPGLSLNLAAFHYDYKNIQVFLYQPGGASLYQNAASARVNGGEFEASWNVGGGLSFSAGATFLDAKYKKFPRAASLQPTTDPITGEPIGGNDTIEYNANGKRLVRAPKVSGNFTINYETQLDPGKITAYLSAHYNSGYKYDPAGTLKQPKYATLDSEISFSPNALPGARFVIWGRNLTDKTYFGGFFSSVNGFGGLLSPPRTVGGRIEYAF
jgi:iron complex outermembrane receptor protein